MSLSIILNKTSRTISPTPLPRSRVSKSGKVAYFSEATIGVRTHMKEKTFSKIRCSEITDFIEKLILNVDKNEHRKERQDLKIIRGNFFDPGTKNLTLLRLTIINRKNPIILALKSLNSQAIDHLKTVCPPKFFPDFFKELEFQAWIQEAIDTKTVEEALAIFIPRARSLADSGRREKADELFTLIDRFASAEKIMHDQSMIDSVKLFNLRKIAYSLFNDGYREAGGKMFIWIAEKACELFAPVNRMLTLQKILKDLNTFKLQSPSMERALDFFSSIQNSLSMPSFEETVASLISMAQERSSSQKESEAIELLDFTTTLIQDNETAHPWQKIKQLRAIAYSFFDFGDRPRGIDVLDAMNQLTAKLDIPICRIKELVQIAKDFISIQATEPTIQVLNTILQTDRFDSARKVQHAASILEHMLQLKLDEFALQAITSLVSCNEKDLICARISETLAKDFGNFDLATKVVGLITPK